MRRRPDRLARRTPPTPHLALVLGAGNVSAIPVTDALTMILQNNAAVLLKMNPVNDYLGPIFKRTLRPLIDAGCLRLVYGGAEVGAYAIDHAAVDSVHITGSTTSHNAIVWGADPAERRKHQAANNPLVTKPVTSELGNVTPWAIVPGDYTDAQLVPSRKHRRIDRQQRLVQLHRHQDADHLEALVSAGSTASIS